MTIDEEKQQLRATIRRLSAQLPFRYREAADRAIARHLLALPEYRSAGAVFCFVSAGREIDTRPILEQTLADGIGAFLFGPLSAAVISIVVAVVEMFTVSDTGPIGCIMNVLATCAFCCTAAFVYKKFHTRKGAVIGLALGTVCLTVVMLLWNYLITPIYMGMDREEIVVPMLIPVFLPFNLVKGGLNMALILLLYKPVVTALRKARLVPESHAPVEGKGKLGAGFLLFSLALLATFVVLALVLMGIL